MKVQSGCLAIFVAALSSCSTGSSPSKGAGGSHEGGNGSTASCSSIAACGGTIVGSWSVTSSCLKVTGKLDLALIGATCAPTDISGTREVNGAWSAHADGTFTDDTTTTGVDTFNVEAACKTISSTPVECDGMAGLIKTLGYASVTCTDQPGGACACSAKVQQIGGLGVLGSEPARMGNHRAQGGTLTLTDNADTHYSYCVSRTTLTVTPVGTSPTLTGSILFGADAGTGIGGGGQRGDAGSAGNGGAPASSGAGGASGQGGMSAGGAAVGGAGGALGGAGGSSGGSLNGTTAPCDIYKSGGTPCVAAHSTVRALFGGYGGKLYQVRNAAGATQDIHAVAPGGPADAASQDAFCMGTTCVFTIIYDQTGKGLDLTYEGPGSKVGGGPGMMPASATKESVKISGSKVYSAYIQQGNAFWVDGSKLGMPLGAEPEGIYMVTSGTHPGGTCCFDYGNSETGRAYGGGGTMDALNFSTITAWQTGTGNGPWVLADLEAGLFSSGDKSVKVNMNLPSLTTPFVTAILKNNGTTEYSLRGNDATSGSLKTFYKGKLPGSYMMKKEGALVLGSGGDCCLTNRNLGEGTFYEGAIVSGYPSDQTEDAVQANIVAARYSK